MKKTVLSILCALLPAIVMADYSSMMFQTTNGTSHFVGTEGLTITFDDENLTATDGTNTLTLALADIAAMSFSSDLASSVSLELNDKAMEPVTVYLTNGAAFGAYSCIGEAMQSVPAGIYVIKYADGSTLKLSKK